MEPSKIINQLDEIMDSIYKICLALVAIVDQECCEYGFSDEIATAERYIEMYERDHKEVSDG